MESPSYNDIKRLQEEVGKLAFEAHKQITTASEQKRAMTPEENATYDKRSADMFALNAQLKDLKAQQEAAKVVQTRDTSKLDAWKKSLHTPARALSYQEREAAEQVNYALQTRAIWTTTGVGTGDELLPEVFIGDFYRPIIDNGDVLPHVTVINTDGYQELRYTKVDDTSNTGERLGEGSSATIGVVPATSKLVLKGYKYSSKVHQESFEMLQSLPPGYESELASMLAERISRALNSELTLADGSSKPQGFVYGASAGITSEFSDHISYEEVRDLINSMNAANRNTKTCKFFMNDNTLNELSKLTDDVGRSLFFNNRYEAGLQDTIGGYGYVVNRWMANMGSGNVSIVFADLKKGYRARLVNGINLWVDDTVDFIRQYHACVLADGGVIDNTVIKKLTHGSATFPAA